MKKILLVVLLLGLGGYAKAGTVIVSSATYEGSCGSKYCLVPMSASVGLPTAAPYVFTLNAVQTSGSSAMPTITAYITQFGPSGQGYTVINSTFAACSTNNCFVNVNPDVYEGGNLAAGWSVVGGSATITITARQLNN